MQWLPRTNDTFEIKTEAMSRPAAWATMAALVLAEFVIIALIIKVLLGVDAAFLAG
jgi:hypothetical protein